MTTPTDEQLQWALKRFWSKVDKTGDCWNWTGYLERGRAKFIYKCRCITAARWIYKQVRGVSLSRDQHVCHRCDNPACVNPDHLFVGSHLDNVRDRVAKGRSVSGPQKQFCKYGHALTPDNVYLYKRQRSCATCKRASNQRTNRKASLARSKADL